jgi:hypothetical protein
LDLHTRDGVIVSMVVVEAMFAGKSGGGFDRRLEE